MRVRELTEAERDDVAAWRYPGRYATYDVTERPQAGERYWAVVDEADALVGYCCLDELARVPGVAEEAGTVDVGYGMRPELMGEGRGAGFVSAVLAFVVELERPLRLRLSIYRWNERSRRAALRQGFRVVGAAGRFDVLVRDEAGR